MSGLKWGDLGTHGLVGGEQRRFADAAFLCPSPRSTTVVAWQAFAVGRVNQKALVSSALVLRGILSYGTLSPEMDSCNSILVR